MVVSGLGGVGIPQDLGALVLELNTHKPGPGVRKVKGGSSGRQRSRGTAAASYPSGESPCVNGYELLNGCSFTSTLSDLSQETFLGPTQIRDTQEWEFWKI